MKCIVSQIVKLYMDLYLKSVSSSDANQYYFSGRGKRFRMRSVVKRVNVIYMKFDNICTFEL